MPTRRDIEQEMGRVAAEIHAPPDFVRRKYLKELSLYTDRDTILYASNQAPINREDIQGFMAACHGLKRKKLDLILHSPGGMSEAAEQIVSYLRKRYDHIRALIPANAMSAATMIACACDEIVMGKQSALGPVDPQMLLYGPKGPAIPAHAILGDIKKATEEVTANPAAAALWIPKFKQLPLGFLTLCEDTIRRAEELVKEWLQTHAKLSKEKSKDIASWLASHGHLSHGKPIDAIVAKSQGMNIVELETDQQFQDLLLSAFHATMVTFLHHPLCIKIIENHEGKGIYHKVPPQAIHQAPQPQGIFPLSE